MLCNINTNSDGQNRNWVQSLEGAIDTAHFSFLHKVPTKDETAKLEIFRTTSAIGAGQELQDRIRWVMDDPRPKFAILGHDTGLTIGAARKTDSVDKYWRISQFLMPNHALVPVAFPGDVYHGQCWVPVDDVNCWIYTYSWLPDRPFTNSEREKYAKGLSLHAEVDADYVPVRNIRNDYMLDREKQKTESFTGIMGVSEQDAAIQDSQGPIQDRTREHLGPTDVGIVEFRKLVMGAARAMASGEAPKAAGSASRYAVRAGGWIAGPDKDFATVMTERFGHRHGYVGNEHGLAD
jgi:phthalate 4,5-dioxygenase oxygenase subunit